MVIYLLILPCGGLDIVVCCDHVLNAVVVSFSLWLLVFQQCTSVQRHSCFGCMMVSDLVLYVQTLAVVLLVSPLVCNKFRPVFISPLNVCYVCHHFFMILGALRYTTVVQALVMLRLFL